MNSCAVYTGVMSEVVGLQLKSLFHKDTNESKNSEAQCSYGKSFIKVVVYKYPSLTITSEENLIIGYVIWTGIKQEHLY